MNHAGSGDSLVSKLSIPLASYRQKISLDSDLTLEALDQFGATRSHRDQLGYRLAMLGDYDAVALQVVQNREALGFELGSVDVSHSQQYSKLVN